MSHQLKAIILILTLTLLYIYLKIETKVRLENILHQRVKECIKDRINERMTERIKNHHRNKNHTTNHHWNKNQTTNYKRPVIHYETEIKKLEEFTNITDYEAMWDIAIDKWTRNWNFYREQLTDSILSKFSINPTRKRRQTNLELIELTSQNANGSATGPQDIFIEHYDCDVNKINNVKYYELNKINACKFKPLDLEMTRTEVKLLSKARAVEIKPFAVTGTIRERVEWCSQHTDYIRANRPSYYYSDARRIKILDTDEVRNELARINFIKKTRYKPTNCNISFNYLDNPQLQKRLEEGQGRIQFDISTPMVPPYG